MALTFIILPFQKEAAAQYAHTLGGSSFDQGTEVGMDFAGNAYFIGEFKDTLDFDPSASTQLLKNFNTDVFVASYNELGALRFAFKISGNAASHEGAGDIAVASDGDFVITGSQPFGSIDFDADPLEEMVRVGELYIAGYNSDGEVRFAVSPGGGKNTSAGKGNAVALDDEGNVYATGFFATTFDFNPADTTGIVSNAGSGDSFLASYTESGAYRYAFSFGGEGFDYGSDIGVDSEGNVYIAGYFYGEAFFDPNDVNQDGDREARVAVDNSDMFLVSYDKNNAFRFVYTFEGTSRIETSKKVALSIDGSDNVYISGESFGTVAFDPEDTNSDGNVVNRTAEPLGSAFLASYDPNGWIRFATVLKGGASHSSDVFVDIVGISYITGGFNGDIDFDPNIGEAVLSSSRGSDVFVASYDSEGAYRTAFQLPSTGLSSGTGITADSFQNIVLTGGFGGEFDMDQGAGEDWRTGAGQDDIFMARFEAGGRVSVGIETLDEKPGDFTASTPYPNPFVSQTAFNLSVDDASELSIAVFDLLGREVMQLHKGMLPAGTHQFVWDGDNTPNGLYLIRIEDGRQTKILRSVRMR